MGFNPYLREYFLLPGNNPRGVGVAVLHIRTTPATATRGPEQPQQRLRAARNNPRGVAGVVCCMGSVFKGGLWQSHKPGRPGVAVAV